MPGKGVWCVFGGENKGFGLRFKLFRALCLYVWGGGGALCGMEQWCCQL